jgi:hypothetical protein
MTNFNQTGTLSNIKFSKRNGKNGVFHYCTATFCYDISFGTTTRTSYICLHAYNFVADKLRNFVDGQEVGVIGDIYKDMFKINGDSRVSIAVLLESIIETSTPEGEFYDEYEYDNGYDPNEGNYSGDDTWVDLGFDNYREYYNWLDNLE